MATRSGSRCLPRRDVRDSRGPTTPSREVASPLAVTVQPRSEFSKAINGGKNILAGAGVDHPMRQAADHASIGRTVPLAMSRTDVRGDLFEMPQIEEPQAVAAALRDQPELTAKDGIDRRERPWRPPVDHHEADRCPFPVLERSFVGAAARGAKEPHDRRLPGFCPCGRTTCAADHRGLIAPGTTNQILISKGRE